MRKDVRLGAVIGGLFIVVIGAYAIVFSRGHSDRKKDAVVLNEGKGDPSKPGGSDVGQSLREDPLAALTHLPLPGGDPVSAAPPAAPAPTATDSAPAAPTASAGNEAHNGANWSALLSAEHVEDVMPAKTHTPPVAPPASVETPAAPAETPAPTDAATPPAPENSQPDADHVIQHAAPAAGAGGTHRIAENETFSSIARDVYGNAKYYKEIAKANPKIDSSHLRVGMVIVLPDKSQFTTNAAPAPSTPADAANRATAVNVPATPINPATQYRVQSGDNLNRISMKLYNTANKVDAIYQLNKATIGADPARLKLNTILQLPEPPTQTASR